MRCWCTVHPHDPWRNLASETQVQLGTSAKTIHETYTQWNLRIMDTIVCNREVSLIQRVHPVMWWPFPAAPYHVFETLACTSTPWVQRPWNIEEWIEMASLQLFTPANWYCHFQREICIDFVHWGVSREVYIYRGGYQRWLCTVNYREWTIQDCSLLSAV